MVWNQRIDAFVTQKGLLELRNSAYSKLTSSCNTKLQVCLYLLKGALHSKVEYLNECFKIYDPK